MSLTWNDLFQQGTLIDFSEHIWRARAQLKASDLGIVETSEVKTALSFGCQRLAPAEEFEEINSISRLWKNDIEFHSLNFPLLFGVRYVPDAQVAELEGKLSGHRVNFEAAVRKFLSRYEEIKAGMLPILEQALLQAAKTPEAAALAFDKVQAAYPSIEVIESKFSLEWNFFTVQLPLSEAAKEVAQDTAPQIKRVLSSMVNQLRTDLTEKITSLLAIGDNIQQSSRETFSSKSISAAMSLLDRVDQLNILKDDTLQEQVEILRNSLAAAKDGRPVGAIMTDLSNAKRSLEEDLEGAVQVAQDKLTQFAQRKITIVKDIS